MSRKGCGSQPKRTKPTIRRRVQRWPRGWSNNPRTIRKGRRGSMAATAIGNPRSLRAWERLRPTFGELSNTLFSPEIHLYLSMRSMKMKFFAS